MFHSADSPGSEPLLPRWQRLGAQLLTLMAVLALVAGCSTTDDSALAPDQLATLKAACVERGLFFDESGVCFESDPAGLSDEDRVAAQVPAALPEPPVVDPPPTGDQVTLLQQACVARELFFDEFGSCYDVDPAGLSEAERNAAQVGAALPEPPVVDPPASVDQLTVLRQACVARGLFYDDAGNCYETDPTGLDDAEREAARVPAELPDGLIIIEAEPSRALDLPPEEPPVPAIDLSDHRVVEPFVSRPPLPAAGTELHMIGLYEPDDDLVTVTVEPGAANEVLVLTAYDPTDWYVIIEDGAQLEYIIVSGYHAQQVFMAGSDIPVYASSYDEGGSFEYFYAFKDDSEPTFELEYDGDAWLCTDRPDDFGQEDDFLNSMAILEDLTGQRPRGMQGRYSGEDFAVNELSRDAVFTNEREGGYCYEGMAGQRPS